MADPTWPHALTRLTAGELAQAWRDQETSLAVIRQDPADDPAPLDDLPMAGDSVTAAPDRIKEAIYAAFDIHSRYRKKTRTRSPAEPSSLHPPPPPSPP
jgi:hypothetical protein